jgi:hypothetical protein
MTTHVLVSLATTGSTGQTEFALGTFAVIDEASRRNINFDERFAAPVVLGDRQTWWVPKPWLEIRPVFENGRAVRAYPVLTYDEQVDQLVEALGEAEESAAQVVAAATLAAHLLCWHYKLSDADLDRILCFRLADEDCTKWVRDIMAIATGQSGPKRSCAGSA